MEIYINEKKDYIDIKFVDNRKKFRRMMIVLDH